MHTAYVTGKSARPSVDDLDREPGADRVPARSGPQGGTELGGGGRGQSNLDSLLVDGGDEAPFVGAEQDLVLRAVDGQAATEWQPPVQRGPEPGCGVGAER